MAINRRTYSIVWSPRSIKTYDAIIQYIKDNFSDTEVQKFVRKTDRIINYIVQDPKMFRLSATGKNKYIVVISKRTILYYRHKPNKGIVELLLFWDTRQNPQRVGQLR